MGVFFMVFKQKLFLGKISEAPSITMGIIGLEVFLDNLKAPLLNGKSLSPSCLEPSGK